MSRIPSLSFRTSVLVLLTGIVAAASLHADFGDTIEKPLPKACLNAVNAFEKNLARLRKTNTRPLLDALKACQKTAVVAKDIEGAAALQGLIDGISEGTRFPDSRDEALSECAKKAIVEFEQDVREGLKKSRESLIGSLERAQKAMVAAKNFDEATQVQKLVEQIQLEPDWTPDRLPQFINLLDPKVFATWTLFNLKRYDNQKPMVLRNGVLTNQPDSTSMMISPIPYENYVLRLEWRGIDNGTGRYGGAVRINVDPTSKSLSGFPTCTNISLYTDHVGELTFGYKGSLSGHSYPDRMSNIANPVKPIGEWNTMEIHCSPSKVKVLVNSVLVNEGERPIPRQGRIAFSSGGSPIEFRNVVLQTNPSPF